jgi:PAS domain S-box-containing protein
MEDHYKTRFSGEYSWVYFKFAYLEPNTVLLFTEIITERKKAEQQLIKAKEEAEKRERDYSELVHSLGEGHLRADVDGYIISANLSMAKMYGLNNPKEMIGMHMKQIYANPADRDQMICKLKEKGILKNYELQLKRVDGTLLGSICNIRMLFDDKGQIVGTEGLIRDINELKLTEKALRESEEKYRVIAENTSDGILTLDANDKVVYASSSYLSQFGYSKQNSLEKNKDEIYEVIHPDDRDDLFGNIYKAIKDKKHDLVYTYRFKNGNGEYMWREDHAKFQYDENGNYAGTNVICRDVTERKRAENALLESEERFKNMFEYHDAAMLLIEPLSGNIINANQSAVQYYGYPKSELCSKNIAEINTLSPEQIKAERENAFNNHRNYFISPHMLSNGEIRTVEVHSSPINFQGKRVLFSIIHDITERQKAETDLQKSKKLLSQAEEIADMGSWEYDYQNDIVYWSDGMFKIFKLSPELGEPKLAEHSTLLTNESFDQLKNAINECIKTGIPYKIELQAIRTDGEIRTCIGKGRADRNQDGKITKLWGTLNDITERKHAETAIRDMELAKQTIRFKQNFLANMSHEIRTPLTGVLGMIEAFEETKLTKKQKDYLYTIKMSGENLKEIIDQVLDYSKIEAGKVTLKPIVFKFHSVPETAKLLYHNNLKEGVSLFLDIDNKIPEYIKADKYRLSQIMNNLVSNAVKFTKKGEIDIRSQLLESNSNDNEVFIKVEVEDTGPGIPPELHNKLFMPFSQAEDKDTVYHEGTGLGLSICRQLVKLMNGEIGLTGKTSGGSIFWFTFKAEKAITPGIKPPVIIQNGKPVKLNILLAEDKLVNQKVVKLMLNSLGHTVTVVNNGQEALDHYQSGEFDLILMDIQMPVMNGVAATQMLKEEYPNLPPVVGLSANAFEGDREKYMALGMDEYLTKPVKRKDFEQLMGSLFYSSTSTRVEKP